MSKIESDKEERDKENSTKQELSKDGNMVLEGIMSTIKRYDDYRKDAIEKNSDPSKDDISQMYKMYAMSTISNEAPNLKNYLSAKSKAIVAQYIDIISDDIDANTHEEKKIGINRSRRAAKAAIMSIPKPNDSLNEDDKAALAKAADKVGNHILSSIQKELSQKPQDIDAEARAAAYKKAVMDRLSIDRLNQEKQQVSEMIKSQKIGAHEADPYKQNMLFSAIERGQNDFGDFLSKESKEELMNHLDLLQDQLKASGTTRPGNKSVSLARGTIRTAIMTPSSPPYYLAPQDQLDLQQEAEKAAANIISMVRENLSSQAIGSNIAKRLRDEMLDIGMEFSDKDFDKINNYVSHVTKNLNSDQLSEFEETILDDMKSGIKKNQTFFSKIRHVFGYKKTEISDDKLIHVAANLKTKLYASIEERAGFVKDDEHKYNAGREVTHNREKEPPAKNHTENIEPKSITKNLKKQKNYKDTALQEQDLREKEGQNLGK